MFPWRTKEKQSFGYVDKLRAGKTAINSEGRYAVQRIVGPHLQSAVSVLETLESELRSPVTNVNESRERAASAMAGVVVGLKVKLAGLEMDARNADLDRRLEGAAVGRMEVAEAAEAGIGGLSGLTQGAGSSVVERAAATRTSQVAVLEMERASLTAQAAELQARNAELSFEVEELKRLLQGKGSLPDMVKEAVTQAVDEAMEEVEEVEEVVVEEEGRILLLQCTIMGRRR